MSVDTPGKLDLSIVENNLSLYLRWRKKDFLWNMLSKNETSKQYKQQFQKYLQENKLSSHMQSYCKKIDERRFKNWNCWIWNRWKKKKENSRQHSWNERLVAISDKNPKNRISSKKIKFFNDYYIKLFNENLDIFYL